MIQTIACMPSNPIFSVERMFFSELVATIHVQYTDDSKHRCNLSASSVADFGGEGEGPERGCTPPNIRIIKWDSFVENIVSFIFIML